MEFPDFFMWFPDSSSSQKGGASESAQGDELQIEGETSDTWFMKKKAFEVMTFGFTLSQSDASVSSGPSTSGKASGGNDGGRAKFQSFTVDKPVDLASVSLYKACTQGTKLNTAMLAVRKVGGANLLYIQYMFREVSVTGISWKGVAGEVPATETITFEFEAMGFQYVQQMPDGTQGRKLLWSWNAKGNMAGLNVAGLPPAPPFPLVSQA